MYMNPLMLNIAIIPCSTVCLPAVSIIIHTVCVVVTYKLTTATCTCSTSVAVWGVCAYMYIPCHSIVLCVLCRPVLVVATTELSSVPSSMFFSPSEGTSLLGYSTTVSHGQL